MKPRSKYPNSQILQLFNYISNRLIRLDISADLDTNNYYVNNNDGGEDEETIISSNHNKNNNNLITWRNKIRKGSLVISMITLVILWWRKKKQKQSIYSQIKMFSRLRSDNNLNDHRNAIEAPLSVLLAAAKRGIILKALINTNSISYKLQQSIDSNSGSASTTKWKRTILPKDNPGVMKEIMSDIAEGGCLDISVLPESLMARLSPIFVTAFPFIYLFLLYHMLKKLQKGQFDTNDVGTNYEKDGYEKTTFSDVAGIDTAQIELQEIVSYLSNPKPFITLGARPPRGLLLHGKPGLGKTLLARAVAGEANADYFVSCSGSDFVEIYVGQGAKRVRYLFDDARRQARRNWKKENRSNSGFSLFCNVIDNCNGSKFERPPTAVIFIDEIDSIAKCRDGIGRGLTNGGIGGNDEREQTLNALLSELDGFQKSDVLIIVIAATNRVSTLDPAILRPGRFDRHVGLSPPTSAGREAILKIHSRNKKLAKDVDLASIADDQWTYNFTGAELQNVMNEAALLAVRADSEMICQKHLHQSTERIKVMKRYSAN